MNGAFGKFVYDRRNEMRMTLRELSRRLDISAPFLSDIEHGRRLPRDLAPFSKHLATSVEKLEALRLEDRPVPTDLEKLVRRIVREELLRHEMTHRHGELVMR